MGKIQELYEARVRPMVPADRLQLARLILDDLVRSENPVDVSDDWVDDDLADVVAYSARHVGQQAPPSGKANEPR